MDTQYIFNQVAGQHDATPTPPDLQRETGIIRRQRMERLMQDEMTLTKAQRRIGVQILSKAGELLDGNS